MASKRVTLKWRLNGDEQRCGPFGVVFVRHRTYAEWEAFIQTPMEHAWIAFRKTERGAKRACERLAARILGAMTHARRKCLDWRAFDTTLGPGDADTDVVMRQDIPTLCKIALWAIAALEVVDDPISREALAEINALAKGNQ